VKLLDWGIAKVISADVRHTIEGQLVGTPQYLSPEQARGADVTPQSDVYSLGVMAYELFLEQLPFEAETSAEIMAMHLRCAPPPPSELWPDIPASLEDLILSMLAKNAESRPTMLTVARKLDDLRFEMEQRKHDDDIHDERPARAVTVLPSGRSNRFIAPAAGLAPTEKAQEWVEAPRRWHIAIGALAIAASTLLFMLSRDTEQASAATTLRATSATIAPYVAEREIPAVLAPPGETETARVPTGDSAAAQLSLAPELAVATAADDPAAQKPVKRTARSARKLQAKPRLETPLDPDGTIDPYR
jgi:serine/threonine-protein kinase